MNANYVKYQNITAAPKYRGANQHVCEDILAAESPIPPPPSPSLCPLGGFEVSEREYCGSVGGAANSHKY